METLTNTTANTKEVKIVNLGFGLNDGGKRLLHVAMCDCGCRIYRAEKESSLQSSISKVTAKCCGSKLNYVGQKLFDGNTMIESHLKEIKKDVNPKWIQPVNDMVEAGPRGITNQGMIEAIKSADKDAEKLTLLFNTYPEVFISSCKYLKDSLKETFEMVIHSNPVYAKVKVPRRKKI